MKLVPVRSVIFQSIFTKLTNISDLPSARDVEHPIRCRREDQSVFLP